MADIIDEPKKKVKAEPKEPKAKKGTYDQYLVAVNRRGTVDPATGMMKGITLSVTIMNSMRLGQPNSEKLIETLNSKCGDHQNPHGNDTPQINYWFPAGKVKKGKEYKANDIKEKVLVLDEETGEEKYVTGKNIIGIKIHTDKEISHWLGNKPVLVGEIEE